MKKLYILILKNVNLKHTNSSTDIFAFVRPQDIKIPDYVQFFS